MEGRTDTWRCIRRLRLRARFGTEQRTRQALNSAPQSANSAPPARHRYEAACRGRSRSEGRGAELADLVQREPVERPSAHQPPWPGRGGVAVAAATTLWI